ncbi:MAG: branched-chain amino acid transport system permease protein [Gammaproteobacteria bacterium]|jgi:branched-chain amino acid transport system permease protein
MRSLVGKRAFLIVLFSLLLLAPVVGNQYQSFIANLILLYIILSMGLNLLIGFAGQLALANAAMYGIGAYGTGLMMVHFGWPFWAAAPCGILIAVASGTLLALPAFRMSGIYLALATLAFAQTTFWVMTHWTSVTFGAGGFVPPPLDFSPLPLTQDQGIYYLSWIAAVLLYLLARNTMESPIGRAFVAIRDGEIAAQALGIDLFRYKALAFAMSGFYAGVAGALYSGLLGFVGPESFDLLQMVLHKGAVVLGGMGSVVGSVIGGALLTVLVEVTKEMKFSIEIAFGGLLIVFMLFQPSGVVVFFKKWLPGWQERLHYVPPGTETEIPQAPATQARKTEGDD